MSAVFDISKFDKVLESRIRLGIMAVLSVNESIDFNTMKDLLHVTDGNLASHINALEKYAYIDIYKEFVGKKTKTSYRITTDGKSAFEDHLSSLEKLIKKRK